MQKLKADFIRVYSNLPVGLRSDIILVIDEQGPITWNVAYVEIENDTELGQTILTKLSEIGII